MKKVFLLLLVLCTAIVAHSEGEGFKKIKNFKFKTQDLNGKTITESIFKQADITMVNIWATWCGPCRQELPDIGRLEAKLKSKRAQVIAICADTIDDYGDVDEDAINEAKEILRDSSCKFTCLCLDESMASLWQHIQAFPTTIFFDKKGNVVGQVLIGGRSESEFLRAIDVALKAL